MDPFKNPFSPGAGAPPPELVGRDPILDQAKILLGRVKIRRSEKSMLLTSPIQNKRFLPYIDQGFG